MIFICTANSTIECAIRYENTPSKGPFDQIVKNKSVQIKHECVIHVMHCSGTRITSQGTDGFSRACLNQVILSRFSFLTFMPLNVSSIERHHLLRNWTKEWIPKGAMFLASDQWFIEGDEMRLKGSTPPRHALYEEGIYV